LSADVELVVCLDGFCKLRRYSGLASIENVGRISPACQALDRLATNAARLGGSEVMGGGVRIPTMVTGHSDLM